MKTTLIECVENSNRSQTAEALARIHGAGPRVDWKTPDPRDPSLEQFCDVWNRIETKVKDLPESLRQPRSPVPGGQPFD